MAKRAKRVFLSSTCRDLADLRQAVADAIDGLDGYQCVGMEELGARDRTADDPCQALLPDCDVYLGLIGHLYGSPPAGEERSSTEREYEAARRLELPRLLFFADDSFLLPKSLWAEAVASEPAVSRFRARASEDPLAKTFSFGAGAAPDLAKKVTAALRSLALDSPPPKPASQPAPQPTLTRVDVERRYLSFLAERYRYLELKGMGVTDRLPVKLPLLEMYIPLKARLTLPEGETRLEELRLSGRLLTAEERAVVGRAGAPQPVLELLQMEAGVILLGDPGAGKTTLLKMLAVSLADRAENGEDRLGLGDRIPFLIPISGYAEALAKENASLDQFVARDCRARMDGLALESLLQEALEEGRALFLFDGLDEVRDRSVQRRVVDRIESFYAAHRAKGNKFVLTSRIVGYKEVRPVAAGLVEGTLVDFNDEEIEEYLSRWVVVQERAALGEGPVAAASAERERRELLDAVRHNQAVRALAANPLLLTILALMKRQGVTLPEQRAKLYHVYVRTLLEDWNRARSLSGQAIFERTADELLKILAPVALWIHEGSPGVGLVRRSELLGHLEAIYRDERGLADPEAARSAAGAFLRDVNDSCLLLERGSGLYGFIHLTFLEYLAGYALAKLDQRGTESLLQAMLPHVGEPAWREVLLLAIGHLGVVELREISAGRLLVELVEKEPGPPGEAVVLAGLALADLGPRGVPPGVRERVIAALQATLRDDERVEPARRAAAGKALATVGDPRPEVMTIEGMQLCWVPPGPFLMGSHRGEPQSYADEEPRHEVEIPYGYWIGRFPVTVMQFAEYCWRDEVPGCRERVLVGPANAPVIEVAWHEALAFCRWLTEQGSANGWLPGGWSVALPSEAEWEKAARGGLQLGSAPVFAGWNELSPPGPSPALANPRPDRSYPWGPEKAGNRANFDETGIGRRVAVGSFPGGASPVGCEELSGNVWEWTRSLWGKNPGEPELAYPYRATDGREDLQAGDDVARVSRGGSFYYSSRLVRCAARNRSLPADRYPDLGFRVVVRPPLPEA